MSENPWRRNWTWLLLLLAGLLALGLFLAWIEAVRLAKRSALAPTSRHDKPGSAARQLSSQQSPSDRRGEARPANRPGSGWWPQPSVTLTYGAGAGEVGMLRTSEQEPIGPEAFALARNGDIFVADLVNHRVQVFGPSGDHLRSIPLSEIRLNDVLTDASGRLYVFDQVRRALFQFDAGGSLQGTLDLDPADLTTRGYFHQVGDSIYFADAAVRDVLVATLKDGILTTPDRTTSRSTEGIHAESGRVYSVSITRGQALRLEWREQATPSAVQSLEVVLPEVVSARYVGEDRTERVYVQTERLMSGKVILEVLVYRPGDEPSVAARLPENDYAIWTTKLVDVTADGTIVQFLPRMNEARLNMFSEQAP